MKIISGGQTGVDRAALDAALSLGVDGGGWCPAGRLDELGRIPERYPVQELAEGGFAERTARNVCDSDGTLIIHSGALAGGTAETARLCAEHGKPCEFIDARNLTADEAAARALSFVRQREISVLNVAGPRASEWPEGYDFALRVVSSFLRELSDAPPPALSFIVPAHNEEHELAECLKAIHRAAEASGRSHEVIVADDASTDRTGEIARVSGAQVIPLNRRQIAAARNAGARVARGDILFFVDADTHIVPAHVRMAVDALERGCVGGSARVGVDRRLPFWAGVFLAIFSAAYFALRLGIGAFIFTRREIFEEVGGFDEQYFAGEEVYLSIALKKRGRFVILREPVVTSARKIRMHSPWFVLAQTCFIVFGGKRALRRREKLDLWYDGRRESSSA